MLDGTNLNILSGSRQLVQAFGGLDETYGCSEAQLQSEVNFSSRGYPALQTRKLRRSVREVARMHGAYHLNGLLLCRGTGLEYTPDTDGAAVVLENVLTDDRKVLVGMGTKVLIWPDRKAFDTADGTLRALGARWEQTDTVTVQPCDAEGVVYQADGIGQTEPESPKDGQTFLKNSVASAPYSHQSVLEKYNASAGKWVEIVLGYVRITLPGLHGAVKAGDTVTLSGMTETINWNIAPLNGELVVLDVKDEETLVAAMTPAADGMLFYGSWTVNTAGKAIWQSMDGKDPVTTKVEAASVVVERRVPELDFVTECDNRVWGCRKNENTIYACALGDPTNWYSYQGTAADSYTVGVGSDGPFTAAATCLGYVLFFKENCIHKLYGTKPSEYRLSSVRCRGVAVNAEHSLCVIAETLYYLSTDGVMAWDGSLPVKVSAALDSGRLQAMEWTAAGYLDTRYYLYLQQKYSVAGRLLVYDTEKGLWHEESAAGREIVSTGRQLYLWDGGTLWAAEPDREEDLRPDKLESGLQWEAVSGDIGLSVPDDKYVSRVTLRLDADGPAVVTLAARYDGGPWEKISTCAAHSSHERLNLPFEPRRFDTMQVKLSGKGQIALRSMALTLAGTSGNRVQGAVR